MLAQTMNAINRRFQNVRAPGERDPLVRHRARILERLLSKFAALKVYDLSRLDPHELEKISFACLCSAVELPSFAE